MKNKIPLGNKGMMIKHEDGRKGIAYIRDQMIGMTTKWLVNEVNEDMRPNGIKSMWDKEKVTITGYVD